LARTPGVNKFSESVDKLEAINFNVSMNRIGKLLVTCFENEMNFSSLFGITEFFSHRDRVQLQ